MKHLLLILSLLLLSSFITSCELVVPLMVYLLTKETYVGEMENGKYPGQGTLTFRDGDKYVGEWKNGERHGQGIYTWSDGSKYVGEYKDGEPWNGTYDDKEGKIKIKYVNGVLQKLTP